MLVKDAPECLPGAEAAAAGDRFERIRALGQRPPRGLNPHSFHIATRRNAHLIGEPALQLARAQLGATGKIVNGMAGTRICVDRRHDRPDRVSRRLRRPQGHAELRLAARTAQEQHRLTGAASATSRPRSSSTRASARSIPAVTPADVHTHPSLMKIEYAAADGGHPARCRTGQADPLDERRVVPGGVYAVPARDYQRVNAARVAISHPVLSVHLEAAI